MCPPVLLLAPRKNRHCAMSIPCEWMTNYKCVLRKTVFYVVQLANAWQYFFVDRQAITKHRRHFALSSRLNLQLSQLRKYAVAHSWSQEQMVGVLRASNATDAANITRDGAAIALSTTSAKWQRFSRRSSPRVRSALARALQRVVYFGSGLNPYIRRWWACPWLWADTAASQDYSRSILYRIRPVTVLFSML